MKTIFMCIISLQFAQCFFKENKENRKNNRLQKQGAVNLLILFNWIFKQFSSTPRFPPGHLTVWFYSTNPGYGLRGIRHRCSYRFKTIRSDKIKALKIPWYMLVDTYKPTGIKFYVTNQLHKKSKHLLKTE